MLMKGLAWHTQAHAGVLVLCLAGVVGWASQRGLILAIRRSNRPSRGWKQWNKYYRNITVFYIHVFIYMFTYGCAASEMVVDERSGWKDILFVHVIWIQNMCLLAMPIRWYSYFCAPDIPALYALIFGLAPVHGKWLVRTAMPGRMHHALVLEQTYLYMCVNGDRWHRTLMHLVV